MSSDIETNSVTNTTPTFQMKGGLFTLTTLQMLSTNLDNFRHQLEQKVQQAPNFFRNAPVVIDLKQVNQHIAEIDFSLLSAILKDFNLIPVGIKNGDEAQLSQIKINGLAILRDNPIPKKTQAEKPEKLNTQISEENSKTESKQQSKVITEPVRSGQQIYAPEGDLIILAPVSPGAELLADGHIHIYGALRGRALAGINGNQSARIFCQSLEAELVSVAGNYKVSEDFDPNLWQAPVEVVFKEGRLQICKL